MRPRCKNGETQVQCVCIHRRFEYCLYSAVGLQSVVNICANYADKWRLWFGVAKSKVMCTQSDIFKKVPEIYMEQNELTFEKKLNVLEVTYSDNGLSNTHVQNRTRAARRSVCNYSDTG